jgi:hypothetical protein
MVPKLNISNSETVDKASKKADLYKIEGIPTFLLFKQGVQKPIEFSDEPSKEGISRFIKEQTGIEI